MSELSESLFRKRWHEADKAGMEGNRTDYALRPFLDRIAELERIARAANRACIEHWNRADAALAVIEKARAFHARRWAPDGLAAIELDAILASVDTSALAERDANTEARLAAALAVIAKARGLLSWRTGTSEAAARATLESVDLTPLTERDAEKWDEGWRRGLGIPDHAPVPPGINPYRALAIREIVD